MSTKKKQQPFAYSIDPDLYKRSHTPSSTISMGMKPSQASALCWVDQVRREQTLADRWHQRYDPAGTQEAERTAALQRTLARTEARKEAYLGPTANPELHSILYGSATATAAEATGLTRPTGDGGDGGDGGIEAELQKRKVKPSVKYLEARSDRYPLNQRFPRGPATAAQTVGWAAAFADASENASSSVSHDDKCCSGSSGSSHKASADLYKPVRQRPAVLAYHKPEDDDHALLFGYDLQPK